MSDKKNLKILIKRKKNKENKFLKESSLSFIFFRILALSYFPNTKYPTTPQYEIKSQYRVFSQKQNWIFTETNHQTI